MKYLGKAVHGATDAGADEQAGSADSKLGKARGESFLREVVEVDAG